MKIEYLNKGATSTLTITSNVFEFRKHNRCVDAALLTYNVRATRSGFFLLKTVISGKTAPVMHAYKLTLMAKV